MVQRHQNSNASEKDKLKTADILKTARAKVRKLGPVIKINAESKDY